MQFQSRSIRKDVLLTQVWGYESNATENNVEAYVGFLRKKLKSIGSEFEDRVHPVVGVSSGGDGDMIKRLRIKFVCINMTIVTIMLCVIFGLVLHFTSVSMEKESIEMMQSVALDPLQLGIPGKGASGVRLPYFALQLGPGGELLASGGGYYDLTDGPC